MRVKFTGAFSGLPDIPYELVANYRLATMVKDNLKPYETIYVPAGLSYAKYSEDLSNNVTIVDYRYDGGSVLVPMEFVGSENISSIPYAKKVLTISLGAISDKVDLTLLLKDIEDIIAESVGVITKIKVHELPNKFYLSEAEDDRISNDRLLVTKDPSNLNYISKIKQKENDELKFLLQNITSCLKTKL